MRLEIILRIIIRQVKKKSTESSTMQKDLMAIKSARLDPHCRILYNTFPLSQCESPHGIII